MFVKRKYLPGMVVVLEVEISTDSVLDFGVDFRVDDRVDCPSVVEDKSIIGLKSVVETSIKFADVVCVVDEGLNCCG